MELYDLTLTIEELKDGGDYRYLATSSQLPNLLVGGETVEEVLQLAPRVAAALIASMKAAGDPMPKGLKRVRSLPCHSRLAVVV